MPLQQRTCRRCDQLFILHPNKPGNINDCPEHSGEDVPLLMGKVAWAGKHEMFLEITADREEATAFNKAQRRGCVGTLSSMCGGKGDGAEGRESSKRNSGAELGAIYHTGLNEKWSVKR